MASRQRATDRTAIAPPLHQFDHAGFSRLIIAHVVGTCRPALDTPREQIAERMLDHVRRSHEAIACFKPMPSARQLEQKAERLTEWLANLTADEWAGALESGNSCHRAIRAIGGVG